MSELKINQILSSNFYGKFKILGFEKGKKETLVIIKFIKSNNIYTIPKSRVISGGISDSIYEEENFMSKIYPQKCGDDLKVLEKTDIKTDNSSNYLYKCQFQKYPCEILARKIHILNGHIFNPMKPSYANIGFQGIGKYSFSLNKKISSVWKNILDRCYRNEDKRYKFYGAKGITVCEEWLNFQNFAAWYEEYSSWNINNYKLELDKDILSNINHLETKIYSPNTCLLIPSDLNCFLLGDNLNCGLKQNKNDTYYVAIKDKDIIHRYGSFNTFKEAKEIYAKEKYKIWKELVNKYNLPNNLKETLLKYDFSWSWLLI